MRSHMDLPGTTRRRLGSPARDPLRIGVSRDFAPLATVRRGRPDGFIIDIVTEAFRRATVAARFLPCDDSSLLRQLARRAIDAAVPVAVTPERRRRFRFSEVLAYTAAGWFVRHDAAPIGQGLLAGARVTTPARGPLATVLRQQFPHLIVLPTPDYETALDYVARGVVEAAALNLHAGLAKARHFPGVSCPASGFCRLPIALAFRHAHTSVDVLAFNAAIRAMKAQGVLRALRSRHVRRSSPNSA